MWLTQSGARNMKQPDVASRQLTALMEITEPADTDGWVNETGPGADGRASGPRGAAPASNAVAPPAIFCPPTCSEGQCQHPDIYELGFTTFRKLYLTELDLTNTH